MKHRAFILCLLITVVSQAQLHHAAGVANTYTLGAEDGFPGYNYENIYAFSPSGKIYIRDFLNHFHITGNNFIKDVASLKSLANHPGKDSIKNWESIFIEQKEIRFLKNDSIVQSIPLITENKDAIYWRPYDKNVFIFRKINNNIRVYKLENYEWKLKNTINWNEANEPIIHFPFSKRDFFSLSAKIDEKRVAVYVFDTSKYKLKEKFITSSDFLGVGNFLFDEAGKKNRILLQDLLQFVSVRTGNPMNEKKFFSNKGVSLKFLLPENAIVFQHPNRQLEYAEFDSLHLKPGTITFESNDHLNSAVKNKYYPYLTGLMGNKPIRIFPYIKKHPRIFNNRHSNNIFALSQDEKGRIWAGNYQNELSIITPEMQSQKSIINLPLQPFPFMNASLNYHGNVYFVGETLQGGLLRYDMKGKMYKANPGAPVGYFLYLSPKGKQVFLPSGEGPEYPVYYCNVQDLDKPFNYWKKIDTEDGMTNFGMASVTEDTLGRIWMGHPTKGIAVFDPITKKAKSYDTRLKESPIGFVSSLTDNKGTIWMGSGRQGANSYFEVLGVTLSLKSYAPCSPSQFIGRNI